MAESKEELKNLMMKVKEESEKVCLKFNIQKMKIMLSGPTNSWQIEGKTMEIVRDFILGGPKVNANGDCSQEIKTLAPWKESCDKPAAQSLQLCPTLCDPIDGSPPGSPSQGFSRQEHWSGLPFPSPMHESEKWKWSSSVVSDSQWPHGLQPTRLLHPRDCPGMTNLDSILKSRGITLPTKVCLVKAITFPVVLYGLSVGP